MTSIKNFLLNSHSKFKNYSFDTMLDTLLKQSNVEKKSLRKPTLYVVAGPNGSGKSTLVTNFINYQIFGDKFVNAGIYAQTVYADIKGQKLREVKSMNHATAEFERLVKEHKSFIFETVLSHESKLDLVKFAKKNGYKIVSIYVFTDTPEINIERVKRRTEEGAVDVDEKKVYTRYSKSLQNAFLLKEISDEFYQMNNTRNID